MKTTGNGIPLKSKLKTGALATCAAKGKHQKMADCLDQYKASEHSYDDWQAYNSCINSC